MPKKVIRIPNNPNQKGFAEITHDVVFSRAGGEEIKMSLILPKPVEGSSIRDKYPLIVFLQGSGWTAPCIYYQIPQMSWFAKNGYAVAMITHRNCRDSEPGKDFPAFLIDTKCAIRYLRAHADEYGIDKDRVAFWGTSSGGNTALLVALTGDDPRYKTEYPEESDAVKCVLDCFGPSDMSDQATWRTPGMTELPKDSLFYFLTGSRDPHSDRLKEISPLLLLPGKKDLPPILLMHGDRDTAVPLSQSERMYEALLAGGHEAEMIVVEGAPHEGSFWTDELMALAADFIKRKL